MTNMPTKTPNSLRTPSDLGEAAVEKSISVLNPLVADAIALWLKTKSYHWHVAGRHFRDYHLLLDDQAGEILASVDPMAERVRKLGGQTVTSIGMVSQHQSVMDVDDVSLSARDMLLDLMEENKRMAAALRNAHGVCDEAGDVGSASILEDFIDQAEERTWFLFETTREQ
ncbi:Dps family protein [Lewinella sp. W8]|uniref:Dps family protein n=1 Tax=Lewinella sp. W8 TaxID=2528208 RepID=UPI001067734F|nr:DNA starvation/stationary phase protection protein [Lewinella sp. W8]MTB52692.1 DNA starvation/stationary phase protection protein [Lewinella sp. W8]